MAPYHKERRRERHVDQLARRAGAQVAITRQPYYELPSRVRGTAYSEQPMFTPRAEFGTPQAKPYVLIRAASWHDNAYWATLHELGHTACNHLGDDHVVTYRRRVLEAEAEAWLWAFDHSAEPLTPDVRDFILGEDAFGSYLHSTLAIGPAYNRGPHTERLLALCEHLPGEQLTLNTEKED